MFQFKPAVKEQLKARIALEGHGGSGKTFTALTAATALGNRIAMVDTNRRQGLMYGDLFSFDHLALDSFHPDALVEALAAANGYDTIIVDTASAFWSGRAGMLEQVDRIASGSKGGSGSGFTSGGWKEMRPVEARMMEALFGFPGHLIVTLRVKSEYVIEEGHDGRKKPVKLGLKPEQRDGFDYDFDLVGSLDRDHTLTITKSHCPALADAVIPMPDNSFAATFRDWLNDGTPKRTAHMLREDALSNLADDDSLRALWREARELGILGTALTDEHQNAATLAEIIARKADELKASTTS